MPPTNLEAILQNSSLNTSTKRQRIQAFISAGGDINALTSDGITPLMSEVESGTDEIVNILLDAGADVNVKDRQGNNVLMASAFYCKKLKLPTIQKMIDKTTNLDLKNKYDRTALNLFSFLNENDNRQFNDDIATAVVEALLAKGVDPNIKDDDGNSPLINALENAQFDKALIIAKAPTLDVNLPMSRKTHLIRAIQNNATEVTKTLIERGANVNGMPTSRKETPLMVAVSNAPYEITNEQRQDLVRLLLSKGADKNIHDENMTFAYNIAKKEQLGEDLYNELKPTVTVPGSNRGAYNWFAAPSAQQYQTNYYASNINNRPNNQYTNTNDEGNNRANNRYNNRGNTTITRANNRANNTTLANRVKNTQPSTEQIEPKDVSVSVPLQVFDAYEAGDVSLTLEEIAADTEHLYFKKGNSFLRISREYIQSTIDDYSGIFFECNKELTGAPRIDDIYPDTAYILLRSAAQYLVRFSDIVKAIANPSAQVFELSRLRALENVATFASVMRPATRNNYNPMNYAGREVDIVSADHCQGGSKRDVYALAPIVLKVSATTKGGRRNKHRKTVLKTKKRKVTGSRHRSASRRNQRRHRK